MPIVKTYYTSKNFAKIFQNLQDVLGELQNVDANMGDRYTGELNNIFHATTKLKTRLEKQKGGDKK